MGAPTLTPGWGRVAARPYPGMIVTVIHTMLSTVKERGDSVILTKLQEALSEVATQRAALNEVEAQLRAMIGKLSGSAPGVATIDNQLPNPTPKTEIKDRIDVFVDILRAEGHPLHITVLADRLAERTGEKIDRTKIEPGLNRHVANTKRARIAKFGPSLFGLPEWKPESATSKLTEVA